MKSAAAYRSRTPAAAELARALRGRSFERREVASVLGAWSLRVGVLLAELIDDGWVDALGPDCFRFLTASDPGRVLQAIPEAHPGPLSVEMQNTYETAAIGAAGGAARGGGALSTPNGGPARSDGSTPDAPQAPRPASGASEGGWSGGLVLRPLGGPRPDGQCALRLAAPRSAWAPWLLALAQRPTLRSGSHAIELPGGEEVDVLVEREAGRGRVVVRLPGELEVQAHLGGEHNGDDRLVLVAPRQALWAGPGFDAWLRRALDVGTWLGLGQRCEDPAAARALRWRVERLDVCLDLSGPDGAFTHADAPRWLVGSEHRTFTAEAPRRGAGLNSLHLPGHGKRGGPTLSISVGDKTQTVLEVDACDVAASIYGPVLRALGWDGVQRVYRVEVRARGRGLRRRGLDLTDPANLTAENLRGLFAFAVGRFQLLDATGAVDPRWRQVQAAAGTVADLGPCVTDGGPRLPPAATQRRARSQAIHAGGRYVAAAGGDVDDVVDMVETFAPGVPVTRDEAALALMRGRCEGGGRRR